MLDPLETLNGPALTLILSAYFILACAQTLHTVLLSTLPRRRVTMLEIAFEGLLAVHFVLMSSYAFSFALRLPDPVLDLFLADVPFSALLWVNAFICMICVATCIQTRIYRYIVDIVLLALCTPLFDYLPVALILADLGVFAFRVLYRTLTMRVYQQTALRRTSTEEAVNKLPDGVLYLDAAGRTTYLNEAMRSCLHTLHMPCALADARTIWPTLVERYSTGQVLSESEPLLRVQVSPTEVRHFTHYRVRLATGTATCIIAYDTTRVEALRTRIEQANRQLEQTSEELNASLADVSSFADNEAMLRMRSQVHDVIGQRLSILHRYLEDDNISDETIARMEPLLTSMLDEIAEGVDATGSADERLTLENVVNAFAIIGVNLHPYGKQPEDEQVALGMTRIIREASTNAVRHGQATRVYAAFARDPNNYWLTITNDGFIPDTTPNEGSGMRGMRTIAEGLGGTFSYRLDPRFTIEVTVPRRKGDAS